MVVNTTNIDEDDKELKIDGFITNQNVQSTKNSVTKKPLKIKKPGIKRDHSECSDPGTTLRHNMISKQGHFK